jgi:hypothetical protein
MTITDRDIRAKVVRTITSYGPASANGIDIDGVVREIIQDYGLIDIEGWHPVTGNPLISDTDFWEIVRRHDATQQDA